MLLCYIVTIYKFVHMMCSVFFSVFETICVCA